MASQTEDASSSPITSEGARGRIYERPGGSPTRGNKGMLTFLLLLAIVLAAIIALAWAF